MRHHALTAAIGTVLAAALVPLSATSAAAADPTGYWRKAEQRSKWPGKMLIYRCGSGKRYVCVKIAWVKNPFDEKGKPLRDILNSNKSLRNREIVGLPIARGMAKVGANQWKGNIYNPEDGNTYSATLTLVSRKKIILKGCKAFLLCGERVWVRTSAPPKDPEPKPEEQIEANAEPQAAPVAAAETAPAAAPEAGTNVITPTAAPVASEPASSMGETQMITPAAEQSTQPGYHFLNNAAAAPASANFTGNDLPSMFHMTKPLDDNVVAATGSASVPVAQPEQPKPQARTIEANAAPTPRPQPKPAPPQAKPKAAPKPVAAAPKPAPAPKPAAAPEPAAAPPPAAAPEPAETAEEAGESTETADATEAAPARPLTWRERRRLRRQQRLRQTQGLPWVR